MLIQSGQGAVVALRSVRIFACRLVRAVDLWLAAFILNVVRKFQSVVPGAHHYVPD